MTSRSPSERLTGRAALAGTVAAAAAGALTVGLIAGVSHSVAANGTAGTSSDQSTPSDQGTRPDPGLQLGSVPQGSVPQGSSHGS